MRRSIAALLLTLLALGCDSVSPTAPIEDPPIPPIQDLDPPTPVDPHPCDPRQQPDCRS